MPNFLTLNNFMLIIVLAIALYGAYKDKREYAAFKQYKRTQDRQRTLKRWLLSSVLLYGLLSVLFLLVLGVSFGEIGTLPPYLDIARLTDMRSVGGTLVVIAEILVIFGVTTAAMVRFKVAPPITGDILALMPKNTQEKKLWALLALNAGFSEELFARVLLPILFYGAGLPPLYALAASCVVFGAMHYYQGLMGMLGAAFLGAVLTYFYLLFGNIFPSMAIHAVIDLRIIWLAQLYLKKNPRTQ